MPFTVIPTLERMLGIYALPPAQRFGPYLQLLQGANKADLLFPVAAYNPMAKAHVVAQMETLMAMGAEAIMTEALAAFNQEHRTKDFGVYLNLADDLLGGWTNRYTTDYDSRFKLNALVSRSFCTPILWSSERFTPELISSRTLAAARRTVYWLQHPQPRSLAEHLEQEIFATEQPFMPLNKAHQAWLEEQAGTDNYAVIFNFLYGNQASVSLGMETFDRVGDFGFLTEQ